MIAMEDLTVLQLFIHQRSEPCGVAFLIESVSNPNKANFWFARVIGN
jgi:hypothetical protein